MMVSDSEYQFSTTGSAKGYPIDSGDERKLKCSGYAVAAISGRAGEADRPKKEPPVTWDGRSPGDNPRRKEERSYIIGNVDRKL